MFFISVRNNSCIKVMFSQVSVCPQGGGVHPLGRHTLLGRHPPWADTPWTDNVRQIPPGQTPPGRHPPWVDTPWPDTSPSQQRALHRTVRILQECIFVKFVIYISSLQITTYGTYTGRRWKLVMLSLFFILSALGFFWFFFIVQVRWLDFWLTYFKAKVECFHTDL